MVKGNYVRKRRPSSSALGRVLGWEQAVRLDAYLSFIISNTLTSIWEVFLTILVWKDSKTGHGFSCLKCWTLSAWLASLWNVGCKHLSGIWYDTTEHILSLQVFLCSHLTFGKVVIQWKIFILNQKITDTYKICFDLGYVYWYKYCQAY